MTQSNPNPALAATPATARRFSSRARLPIALIGLIATLGATGLDMPSASAADPQSRVVYSGRIEDSQGRPIGGIFPLSFSFFRTEKGGRAVWTESHFVAVDNGVYAIELGRLKSFPKGLDLNRAWLSVSITGGKEIVRDRFIGNVVETPTAPVAPPTPTIPPVNPAIGAPPQPAKGTYADLAGFAYEAEKAKSADTIGGLTATDIRNLAKQAQTPPAAAKAKVGSPSRYSDSAGGNGGTEFTLQCPPGHVATGIRGRGAMMIDQISVICSPLE